LSQTHPPPTFRLSTWTLIAFASPGLAATLLISPVFGILPSYYALHTSVTLVQIGGAFLVARVADALIDPMVGILSDRTRTRLGPRLPWMIAGALLAAPSAYFLFLPPPDATTAYFLTWSTATMFAWTLLTIPHGAWAAELSDNYDERSRVFGVRNVLAQIGGFAFFLLPPLLAPLTGTTEIEASTMWALVIALWVLTPLSLLWAAAKVPGHGSTARQSMLKPASFTSILRSITANKPFLSFILITILAGFAAGMHTALQFLFVQDYLKLGPSFFLVAVAGSAAMIGSTPLWLWASRRFSKHHAWAVGLVLGGLVSLPLLILQPGPQSLIPLLIVMVLSGVMNGVIIPLPASVLADIADYESWKQNTSVTGNYFSFLVLISKITAAVGASAALFLSDFLGYVPKAEGDANSVAILTPLVIVPAILHLAAAALVWRFPLNRHRQEIITRRLAERQVRAERAAAAA
jgi:Na+/melibiose symporter-like transporter